MQVNSDFGFAGAEEDDSNGKPNLKDVVWGIIDDLAAVRTAVNEGLDVTAADPAAVSAGALAAFTDPPSAPEMANTRTLVNELRTTTIELRTLLLEVKAKLNGAIPGTVSSADPAAITEVALVAFTSPPSAGEMANLRALVNEIRTTVIAARTLANEIKVDVNAATTGTVPTLTVTKGS